jgi:hypothetical protein
VHQQASHAVAVAAGLHPASPASASAAQVLRALDGCLQDAKLRVSGGNRVDRVALSAVAGAHTGDNARASLPFSSSGVKTTSHVVAAVLSEAVQRTWEGGWHEPQQHHQRQQQQNNLVSGKDVAQRTFLWGSASFGLERFKAMYVACPSTRGAMTTLPDALPPSSFPQSVACLAPARPPPALTLLLVLNVRFREHKRYAEDPLLWHSAAAAAEAAAHVERRQQQHRAAVVLQACWRSLAARRQLQQARSGATAVQSMFRKGKAKKLVSDLSKWVSWRVG